jgi:hypothetical protein
MIAQGFQAEKNNFTDGRRNKTQFLLYDSIVTLFPNLLIKVKAI